MKTVAASAAVLVSAFAGASIGLLLLPPVPAAATAVLLGAVMLGAAVVLCGGLIVLARYRRGVRGERDLFLELNRSRDVDAVGGGAATPGRARLRRWWARRLLKHDLLVGDRIEVKSWPEIRATLDDQGCLDGLPFMPEMLAMCGRRAVVFRGMHRLFDYRKSRRMRHMDGAVLLAGVTCDGVSHGGCEAACHTIWKAAWLRRIDSCTNVEGGPVSTAASTLPQGTEVLRWGTQGPAYACQLTALHAASQPIAGASLSSLVRPLVSGNVVPAAFVVGWLTHLFNEVQHLRQGIGFPAFEPPGHGQAGAENAAFQEGDAAVVRSSSGIGATLDDRFMHRGLWFEPDMLKHCGHRCVVDAKVTRLIDVVTGEMRHMKTPAYRLRGVHFSGERQLFNAQYEPLLWRGLWLRHDDR